MVDRSDLAIAEILDEITWLDGIAKGRTFADFVEDRTLRYAVERSIEIISEASRRLSPEAKALCPEVPWRSVGGIGNILRHEYHATAPRIVWEVVTRDLTGLKAAMAVIAAHGPETDD